MILTPENYYGREANQAYMSVSQFKDFLQCEEAALAKLNGWDEGKVDAFLLGNYVHSAIEGPEALEQFKNENPDIIASRGKNKGELKAEFKHADKMIDVLMSDRICKEMLQGKAEVIVTSELFGVLWKAKIDVIAEDEGRITDLKTVKSIRDKYWLQDQSRYGSFIEAYSYTLQMAVYSELERKFSGRDEPLEPFIVAVSKEEEPDKEVICFDDQTLGEELQKVSDYLPRVIAVKEGIEDPSRCEKCKYCRQTKQVNRIVHFSELLDQGA